MGIMRIGLIEATKTVHSMNTHIIFSDTYSNIYHILIDRTEIKLFNPKMSHYSADGF